MTFFKGNVINFELFYPMLTKLDMAIGRARPDLKKVYPQNNKKGLGFLQITRPNKQRKFKLKKR
ncbi:hypothetical protein THMIRHAM_20430 [Thiomicrorhabdus immobilis]|uniref:Uncharacterized protein n=1 Tax=Thiomicrorhabdus immobilis TaxID=2791037 RepID=A0ABM7MFN0_9GAMM|nr:hypothetical protein THMIRHAM_20430 [Thiomicrorhabdus immobilis]